MAVATRKRAPEGNKRTTVVQDQSLLLQRARCNLRALEERLQDRDRELQLDYSHALARLWHLNTRQGR